MKRIVIVSIMLLAGLFVNAQNSDIVGKWLLTKEESRAGVEEPYYMSYFQHNHVWEVMGMPIGYWELNKSDNSLTLKSNYFKEMTGKTQIEKITSNEMITLKDGVKRYYTRLKQNEINAANKGLSLSGTWKVTQGAKGVELKFFPPDNLTVVTTKSGNSKNEQCHWIYDAKDKAVIIYGMSHLMRGKHKITITGNKMVLKSNGKTIAAEKE